MRNAAAKDHWRHVYKEGTYPTRIEEINYADIPGLGTGAIEQAGGILAVCGTNGSGKSTLLRCVASALGVDVNSIAPTLARKVISGSISVSIIHDGQQLKLSYDFSNGCRGDDIPTTLNTVWLEPARLSPRILRRVAATENVQELLEQVEPAEYTEKDLTSVAYLLGRRYDVIRTYEIEGILDSTVIPFFEVKSGSLEYMTEQMGLGEYSLLYIFWALRRIDRTSILLLEEPESFVFPRSQECLMNVLAETSDTRKVCCVLSTHSPSVLKNVQGNHIYILTHGEKSSVILRSTNPVHYMTTLCTEIQKRCLIYVEDACAAILLGLVVNQVNASILRESEIVRLKGDGNVMNVVNNIPKDGLWINVVAVRDGDRRATGDQDKGEWPILFLPSDKCPDQMLRDCGLNNVPQLANQLNISETELNTLLGAIDGVDIHEWIHEIAKSVSLRYDQVCMKLFDIWYSIPENEAECKAFVADLYDAIYSR